ncbi:MAG TPA: L,D-transpeptidase family protein [Candidatus Nanoarchaeia archaeon]|nr:L,D-transpeptidase family protein [Candidatus Nanoarchaeia archaeon]
MESDPGYSWFRPFKIGLFVVGLLFVTANTAFAAYFLDRIYPGIKIAGESVGGLTKEQAKARLASKLGSYHLKVNLENKAYDLAPSDLGVNYDLGATVDVAFSRGRQSFPAFLALTRANRGGDIGVAYGVDMQRMGDFVSKLTVSQAQAPVDASVVIVNGQPKVQPEKAGTGLDPKLVTQKLQEAVGSQTPQLSLAAQIIQPDVKAADTAPAIQVARKLMTTKLELQYNERRFDPSTQTIGSWLSFIKQDGKLVTIVDPAKVKTYTKTINDAIYIAPKNHLINIVNGENKGEEAGVEGLGVDQDNLVGQITTSLSNVTGPLVLQVPTMVLPFKTVYNRTINLDAGRYVEINLSSQHLWAYQDHQVVFDTPITSGATGAGLGTVEGLFSIYDKARNRNLNGYAIGYNYNVFVQYWMPFYKDYGLHDASWRSSFGGQDYYYGGSHGCVNMPTDAAAWLFNWADIGTPVWVHT